MAKYKLDEAWLRIRVSSSIENFREKIEKWFKIRSSVSIYDFIFFGMYHVGDYLRFLLKRGPKVIFWAGGDVLSLNKFWAFILSLFPAFHWCENKVEADILRSKGIEVNLVRPVFFGDKSGYKLSYKHSSRPEVFLCAHPNYEEDAGVGIVEKIAYKLPEITFHIYGVENGDYANQPNVIYHGYVPEEQFDDEIKNYQCGLRLNLIDGFSEVTAKSVLLGQYPITSIAYPQIDFAPDEKTLVNFLADLKNKKKPNFEGRKHWFERL